MKNRMIIHISGVVQGIGFRPYIYALAMKHHLAGFVLNNTEGVYVEVEGADMR